MVGRAARGQGVGTYFRALPAHTLNPVPQASANPCSNSPDVTSPDLGPIQEKA